MLLGEDTLLARPETVGDTEDAACDKENLSCAEDAAENLVDRAELHSLDELTDDRGHKMHGDDNNRERDSKGDKTYGSGAHRRGEHSLDVGAELGGAEDAEDQGGYACQFGDNPVHIAADEGCGEENEDDDVKNFHLFANI